MVYGLSQEVFYRLSSSQPGESGFILHCREVLGKGGKNIEVVALALEELASEVHVDFWG